MTEAEKREQARQEKYYEIELFKQLYQPSMSVRENQELMAQHGLYLSLGTMNNWKQKYISHQSDNPFLNFTTNTIEISGLNQNYDIPNTGFTKDVEPIQHSSWITPTQNINYQFPF